MKYMDASYSYLHITNTETQCFIYCNQKKTHSQTSSSNANIHNFDISYDSFLTHISVFKKRSIC